jgi:hypothetical protein
MTHTPPVPSSNQSPYPVEELPHGAPSQAEHTSEAKSAVEAVEALLDGVSRSQALGVGAAVGIGSAAIVAALLYARKRDSKPVKAPSAARKRPESAPRAKASPGRARAAAPRRGRAGPAKSEETS